MENKGISIEEAASTLNIETKILNKHIKAGNIELTEDGMIPLDTFEKIRIQQETLIGIKTCRESSRQQEITVIQHWWLM